MVMLMYGAFEYQGQLVQFQPDSNLRDNEDVPLTAETLHTIAADPEHDHFV